MAAIGRIFGWLMVLAGVGLMVRYFGESAAAGRMIPVAISDMWQNSDSLMRGFMARSVANSVSDAMFSGWTAALLIIFGALLVWGCRGDPARR